MKPQINVSTLPSGNDFFSSILMCVLMKWGVEAQLYVLMLGWSELIWICFVKINQMRKSPACLNGWVINISMVANFNPFACVSLKTQMLCESIWHFEHSQYDRFQVPWPSNGWWLGSLRLLNIHARTQSSSCKCIPQQDQNEWRLNQLT